MLGSQLWAENYRLPAHHTFCVREFGIQAHTVVLQEGNNVAQQICPRGPISTTKMLLQTAGCRGSPAV